MRSPFFQDGIACGVDGQLPFVVRAAITVVDDADGVRLRMPQRLNVDLRGAVRAS